MLIKELFLEASKYAASDWKKFIFLGIIFVAIDLLDHQTAETIMPEYVWYLLIVLIIILLFISTGYLFRIIETSVDGSDQLPPFNNLLQLFKHGVKDSTVVFIYMFIPLMLLVVSTGLILIYFGDNGSIKFPLEIILISIILGIFLFTLLQGAILNMAHNNGKFRAAFDFKSLIGKIRDVGLKKFLIVCFLTALIFLIVEPFILEDIRGSADSVGGTIIEMIAAPYLAILTSRFLGIMGRRQ
ncbi:MAG TPA: DUF4013 domain-containing protein [Methanobacteriaceae archaeon]|nr:DUF4013 domain-containing protein [Methanobacteriaceae archaeon]